MSSRLAVCLVVSLAFLTGTPANRPETVKTGLLPEMQGQIQGKCIPNARIMQPKQQG
jgi:hypothetical protein